MNMTAKIGAGIVGAIAAGLASVAVLMAMVVNSQPDPDFESCGDLAS